MSGLPEKLIESLKEIKEFDEKAFREVHESDDRVTSIRINPGKNFSHPVLEKIPWSQSGYYLPSRPQFIFDPLLHAGAYYVQEASSMFLEQCIKQHTDLNESLRVLDLCASPGGKSTLIQSLIGENSLLVSNEVIKTRVSPLIENITKWGAPNNIVTNNDPKDFRRLENYFDIIVVDAPCSGSGLFRRDRSAIEEWSTDAVTMCSMRQRRILEDVYPALKQNGLLVYSTCSYSEEEDEEITNWLLANFDLEFLPVQTAPNWNLVETNGYRFFPDKLKGEGFYISCFRKRDGGFFDAYPRKIKMNEAGAAEIKTIGSWIEEPGKYRFYYLDNEIFAFPAVLEQELAVVKQSLYTKKAGIGIGKLANGELVPAHDLAVSTIVNKQIAAISLNKEDALQYLRKEEVKMEPGKKGWALARYEGLNLGWMKLLNNRVNNYYPKEWRILKSANN